MLCPKQRLESSHVSISYFQFPCCRSLMSSSEYELKRGNFLFDGYHCLICRVITSCFIDTVIGLIQQYYIHMQHYLKVLISWSVADCSSDRKTSFIFFVCMLKAGLDGSLKSSGPIFMDVAASCYLNTRMCSPNLSFLSVPASHWSATVVFSFDYISFIFSCSVHFISHFHLVCCAWRRCALSPSPPPLPSASSPHCEDLGPPTLEVRRLLPLSCF